MRTMVCVAVATMLLVGALAVPASAEQNAVTPSTNAINEANGWAHFEVVTTGIGQVTVDFISTRAFVSCFEYRGDRDTSEQLAENGGENFNSLVTDGLYPYTCVRANTVRRILDADEFVEIRMVFGAESDERFDWTRLDVGTKTSCKDGGWASYGFENQGQCVRAVVSNRVN